MIYIHWDWVATVLIVLFIRHLAEAVLTTVTRFLYPYATAVNRSAIATYIPQAMPMYDELTRPLDDITKQDTTISTEATMAMLYRPIRKHNECTTCQHIEDSWQCNVCHVIVYTAKTASEHQMEGRCNDASSSS